MKNLIFTIIITLPLTLWGQGWEQTYGGNSPSEGRSVQQTSDGGYVIFGGGKPYNELFNGNVNIASKLKIDLNLRPQNLDFETYFKLTDEYEKLIS